MSKTCEICERKTSSKDATRSHSNIKTLRRQYVNLQTKRIGGVSMTVCTKCISTSKKAPKVKVAKPAVKKVAKKVVAKKKK